MLVATFLVNHFNLFGLEQVYRHLKGEPMEHPKLTTRPEALD